MGSLEFMRKVQPKEQPVPVDKYQALRKFMCQGKIETSYSRQSRTFRFQGCSCEVHDNLCVPVKRRRALLASNPIKEYPVGTHRGR